MFTLHERTRVLLCRAGFLILCVAPTLFVGAASVHYRSPAYLEARREEWIAVLSDKLGLDVQVGQLSYPLWNTALLNDVVLLDPETGGELVRARYLEVRLDEDRWQIMSGQPEVNAVALPLLIEHIDHRLLRGQSLKLAPMHFESRSLTVRNGDSAQTFEQINAEVVTTDSGKRIAATFHVAGVAAEKPIEISVERRRDSTAPRTSCRFSTSGATLPCGTLTPLWPWLTQLGNAAAFNGDATSEFSSQLQHTEVVGRFTAVDLDRLVSDRFPHHRLTGLAEIELTAMRLERGSIEALQGTLQTHGPGIVSRKLVEAIETGLGLGSDLPARDPSDDPLVRYSHFAFGFQLDREGLSLTGYADPLREGVIMAGAESRHLLTESTNPIVPAAHLIRALSPQSNVQVPATKESKSLFDLLPLPTLLPADHDGRPRATLRLRERK